MDPNTRVQRTEDIGHDPDTGTVQPAGTVAFDCYEYPEVLDPDTGQLKTQQTAIYTAQPPDVGMVVVRWDDGDEQGSWEYTEELTAVEPPKES